MIRRKKPLRRINIKRLLEQTVEELLKEDYELLRYLISAYRKTLMREIRMTEEKLRRISEEAMNSYKEGYLEELKKRLEDLRRDVEVLERISVRIGMLNTIKEIELELLDKSKYKGKEGEELKKRNKELWDNIKKIRLKDLLDFKGQIDDKLAVYNYLISVIKGIELPPAEPLHKPVVEEKPTKREIETPGVHVVNEKEYISLGVEGWIDLLNKCFIEGKHIELPDSYLATSMRRPLRDLITAMIEIPPEKLKYVLPRKYKYLLILHNILYTIIKEGKTYVTTPGSSDREYIEGEGGIFNIFQARLENEQNLDGVRRRIYGITIGSKEYKVMKEVILENGKAKQIKYMLAG